ncbi:NmrA/HSCARG family protein [Roseivivax sediminis]|uniref:Uncharacterized conserved protein YbjT, contains NAD(P)-binding and DUF2867 domains n=1 Tax=Roseivivax sediminis TaxID=936889 RepID=A0A1I1UN73_9RHOB|nr:NmrA/HSCARG family protein [Roseivivax sediminis]SFD71078.1 Uncharacterized conserved protein YbjT, contains NAD(P)-binding and DUF2867 domains [Roseivivax sediminis]
MRNGMYRDDRTQSKGTVLVFGATGKQGGAVTAALRARGWAVRALVRNTAREEVGRLAATGVEIFAGEFADMASVENAMAGVDGVFSVQPNSGSAGSGIADSEEVRIGKRVADIAMQSGVGHLVYSSAGIISRGKTGLPNLDTKIEIEEHIRSLDLASTILRPATFMDLFTLPGFGLDQGTFSFFVHPDQPFQAIAVEDIGKIAAQVIEHPGVHAGRTIEIAGDELTGLQLAEALSDAADRCVAYHRFPDELLEGNEFLRRNAKLFEDGRATGNANIAALEDEFGLLWRVSDWLAGPGKPALQAALTSDERPLALR